MYLSKYLPAAMEFEGKSCGFSMLCYELSDEDSEIVEILLAPLTEKLIDSYLLGSI